MVGFAPAAFSGIVHQYVLLILSWLSPTDMHQHPRLVAFEHSPKSGSSNIILFISGLGEGLLNPSYPKTIATVLPRDWTIAHIILSSSYTGWGTSSLAKDAKEIARCVSYFCSIRSGKIVLMGHSTGCQDVMEYLVGPQARSAAFPHIDGGILQASVSDREGLQDQMSQELYNESVRAAQSLIAQGKADEIMSRRFFQNLGGPCTARRWLSLASPDHNGDDDYFSSDFDDAKLRSIWGALPTTTPLSVLYSGKDEFVPSFVKKQQLIDSWKRVARDVAGTPIHDESWAVIPGASHNYDGCSEEIVSTMIEKVLGFLMWLDQREKTKL